MVHSVPKMSSDQFDEMFNSNVKDLLMVVALSQLIKTQLQLNEKLNIAYNFINLLTIKLKIVYTIFMNKNTLNFQYYLLYVIHVTRVLVISTINIYTYIFYIHV